MQKICSKCGESKDISGFFHHAQKADGYHSMCKICQKSSAKNSIGKLKDKVREYKLSHPCACGQDNPDVLTFHHTNPAEKEFKLSAVILQGRYSWETIKAEMDKCIVMCENCHRKLHYPDTSRKIKMRKNNKGEAVWPHARMKKWVYELKSDKKCEVCGETHRQCLDFHHINPAEKSFGITAGIRSGRSREDIEKEVAKCIVLCANCHRIAERG